MLSQKWRFTYKTDKGKILINYLRFCLRVGNFNLNESRPIVLLKCKLNGILFFEKKISANIYLKVLFASVNQVAPVPNVFSGYYFNQLTPALNKFTFTYFAHVELSFLGVS